MSIINKFLFFNLIFLIFLSGCVGRNSHNLLDVTHNIEDVIIDSLNAADISPEDIPEMNILRLGECDLPEKLGDIYPPVSQEIGRVSSNWGWRGRRRRRTFHYGVDIAAGKGTDIYASWDGQVIKSGRMGSCGNGVLLRHANGLSTLYCHCSKILVKQNDCVKKGQTIALIGTTGRSTGNHLHFGVKENNKSVNPNKYLNFYAYYDKDMPIAQAIKSADKRIASNTTSKNTSNTGSAKSNKSSDNKISSTKPTHSSVASKTNSREDMEKKEKKEKDENKDSSHNNLMAWLGVSEAEASELPKSEPPKDTIKYPLYSVQVGAYAVHNNASNMRDKLAKKGYFCDIVPLERDSGTLYKVWVGKYGTREIALNVAKKLKNEGDISSYLIVKRK